MSLRALLRKELRWSKHNVAALVVLLLVLPATAGYASVTFQHVIPQEAPVAVVPGDETTDDGSLELVDAATVTFAQPVRYDSEAAAMDALHREEVYAVVTVPPGVLNDSRQSQLNLTVEGSMVLFDQPSRAMVSILNYRLQSGASTSITVERTVVGESRSLSEYLIPILLVATLMLFAFTYVPYNLASESRAIQRIRTDSSLESLVAAKLLYFTLLMLLPIVTFGLVTAALGYAMTPVSAGIVAALLLSFLAMAAVAMAIMFATRFGTTGRFLSVIVLFGLVAFGGLIYPAGFFSPIRKEIVRAVPLHYTTIIVRSEMLKDVPLGLYADYFALLGATALASLVVLESAIVFYRRGD
ncbi:ABC transporter permease [Halapricum hydrolyticum]|uniref:ABC transporter permease n=1 Tax=Halapricum hydrolyticum TaxID=2979991 RepID=A0AAE3IE61_9EURY|nr:ABC transporter permease [Halapricum hydrolyticum]MCU4719246.1 ABC transporter permease [Halapricum hydrolyticum]MCU4728321.1 ABC transporter permease [Halapricum hydrolyticum]